MPRPEIAIGAAQARHAADTLDRIAALLQSEAGASLTDDQANAARAALSHVARELRAQYGIAEDGEVPAPHDRLDWLDLAIYVNDPF